VTHFFASLGTCGTISGTGGFLKHMSGGKVKVHGIHPTARHDIPGVRSLPQLHATKHFKPDDYDELCEVTNEEAFQMCLRLNREESIIAGPSSGMQVVGAMRLMEDKPGNVGVIIFCDDIFKYTASCERHLPEVFPPSHVPYFEPAELSAIEGVLATFRSGPDTLTKEELQELQPKVESGAAPRIIDVRPADEYSEKLRAKGAISIPLAALRGSEDVGGVDKVKTEQVFEGIAGAVRKVEQETSGSKTDMKPRDVVAEALKKALGESPAVDTPMVLYCNRGIDSLFALLTLKGAGYTQVKHVGNGMFAWAEAGLPMEGGKDLPASKSQEEQDILERLGFTRNGAPAS